MGSMARKRGALALREDSGTSEVPRSESVPPSKEIRGVNQVRLHACAALAESYWEA